MIGDINYSVIIEVKLVRLQWIQNVWKVTFTNKKSYTITNSYNF